MVKKSIRELKRELKELRITKKAKIIKKNIEAFGKIINGLGYDNKIKIEKRDGSDHTEIKISKGAYVIEIDKYNKVDLRIEIYNMKFSDYKLDVRNKMMEYF